MSRFPRKHIKRDLILLKESLMDTWLSRLSHFSQIGLLFVAVFGYVYTVLPVYQKSLLDEQIAQKELQLRSLQIKLDEMYVLNRSEVIKGFIINSTHECTGIDKLPKDASENLSRKAVTLKQRLGEIFEIGMKECLVDTLNKSKKIKLLLKQNDFNFLSLQVNAIGNKLNLLQKELRSEYYALPDKAITNPEILKPLKQDTFIYRFLELGKSSMSDKEYQSKLFDAKIDQALLDINTTFRSSVLKDISSINEIQWPSK